MTPTGAVAVIAHNLEAELDESVAEAEDEALGSCSDGSRQRGADRAGVSAQQMSMSSSANKGPGELKVRGPIQSR